MHRSLLDLKNDIMVNDHSEEEWMQLDKEVNHAFKTASEEEIREFVDSGAGEALDMICLAINEKQKNH